MTAFKRVHKITEEEYAQALAEGIDKSHDDVDTFGPTYSTPQRKFTDEERGRITTFREPIAFGIMHTDDYEHRGGEVPSCGCPMVELGFSSASGSMPDRSLTEAVNGFIRGFDTFVRDLLPDSAPDEWNSASGVLITRDTEEER